jgi:hypothetical protein
MLGSGIKPLVPALIACLGADNFQTRMYAAQLLAGLGANAQEAVPPLTELLDDGPFDQRQAAQALGVFGPMAISAIPRLVSLLGHSDPDVNATIIEALHRIGPDAIPVLLNAVEQKIHHGDSCQAVSALWALGGMGNHAQTAAPRLIQLARVTRNADLRRAALEAVMRLRPDYESLLRELGLEAENISSLQPVQSSGSLVLNGDMDLVPPVQHMIRLCPGAPYLTGWSIYESDIYMRRGMPSPAGSNVVELGPSAAPGSIAQVIATEPGREYELSFILAGGRNRRARLSCGDRNEVLTAPSQGQGYEQITRRFKATSLLSTLKFSATESNGFGPFIDRVVVTPRGGSPARGK